MMSGGHCDVGRACSLVVWFSYVADKDVGLVLVSLRGDRWEESEVVVAPEVGFERQRRLLLRRKALFLRGELLRVVLV
jgi:hypothetical protein